MSGEELVTFATISEDHVSSMEAILMQDPLQILMTPVKFSGDAGEVYVHYLFEE